jgi:D-3-phosphoglycerate dehydrogenase / 2-oxoglutarate reductase
MKIAILDDYHDAVRHLGCFRKLDGHDVTIWNDHLQDEERLADRLQQTGNRGVIKSATRNSIAPGCRDAGNRVAG